MYEFLLREGVLIGSRAWHCEAPYSDYDFCLDVQHLDFVVDYLYKNHIEATNTIFTYEHKLYNVNSMKFYLEDGKEINIIWYNTKDWKSKVLIVNALVHGILSTYEGRNLFRDKTYRNLIVESLFNVAFLEEYRTRNSSLDFPF